MRKSKIMKALLVFGMSMVTATAICFTACDNGDSNDGNDTDIVDTDTGNNEGGNQGGNNQGGTEEKSTEVTEAEWKQIMESTNNFTLTQSSEAGDDYDMLIKVDGDKVAFDDDTVYVKDGEHYYLYYYDSETEKWAKEEIEAEEYNEDAGMFVGIVKSFKDDYKKFTPSNGKYIAASVDKTDTDLDAIVENIEVTFSDGKLVGVKCEIKTEAPKDEEGPNEIFGESTTDEQSEEPTEGTTEEPTEGTTEEPTEGTTEEPTEEPTEYITINYEITNVGSTTVPLPKVDGEANVLGTYYIYWFDDDKGGWKYAGGEDIVVKDDGTCVIDGEDATYVVDNGIVNVNDGFVYAKIEDKIMWLFKTAADADDYTKAMGFAYNGTVISTEDKEKVEENTGKGFVTEGGETPGPGVDLGAYVGTYYSYWPGVEEAVWEYGFDIVVNDDGTCVVDGDKKTYVVDENGVVNVDSGSVYVKIEDKIMWLYENIDSIGDYANAMSFAYKGSNEIPADVKLMIEKITGKGFANEDPNPGEVPNITEWGTVDNAVYNPAGGTIWHHIFLDDSTAKDYDFDSYEVTAVTVGGTASSVITSQPFDENVGTSHTYHMHVQINGDKYKTTVFSISFKKGGEVVATGTYTRVGDKEVVLDSYSEQLSVGSNVTINITSVNGSNEFADKQISWSIVDTEGTGIATIPDGSNGASVEVTAVAAGKATLTCTIGEGNDAFSKTCVITVVAGPVVIEAVDVSDKIFCNEKYKASGDAIGIRLELTQDQKDIIDKTKCTLTVKMDEEDSNYTLHEVYWSGTFLYYKLTVASDWSHDYEFKFSLKNSKEQEVAYGTYNETAPKTLTISDPTLNLVLKTDETVTGTLTATKTSAVKGDIEWKIEDTEGEGVASIVVSEDKLSVTITALTAGTATITATVDGLTQTCTVTVYPVGTDLKPETPKSDFDLEFHHDYGDWWIQFTVNKAPDGFERTSYDYVKIYADDGNGVQNASNYFANTKEFQVYCATSAGHYASKYKFEFVKGENVVATAYWTNNGTETNPA